MEPAEHHAGRAGAADGTRLTAMGRGRGNQKEFGIANPNWDITVYLGPSVLGLCLFSSRETTPIQLNTDFSSQQRLKESKTVHSSDLENS